MGLATEKLPSKHPAATPGTGLAMVCAQKGDPPLAATKGGAPMNVQRDSRGGEASDSHSPRHRGSAGDDRGAMIYPRLPNTFCCALALMGLNYRGLGSSRSDHQLV
jgi:hypothetical protein